MVWRRLAEIVTEHGAAALVGLRAASGSTPRDAGACMVVRPDGAFHGSIGGGQLEWRALAAAREALAEGRGPARFVDHALGPDLGQCCGGRVTVSIEVFDARDRAELAALSDAERQGAFELRAWLDVDGRVRRASGRLPPGAPAQSWLERHGESATPLLLFGAGHVGRALVLALAPLPFAIRWIDSRGDAFPAHIPANVASILTGKPEAELARALPGSFIAVMTHDHSLDLALTMAALRRDDLPYVGLIGSATKRARFERHFRELGISQSRIADLVCPIGLAGIGGKEPAIIAASVAAQLLAERERLAGLHAVPQARRQRSA